MYKMLFLASFTNLISRENLSFAQSTNLNVLSTKHIARIQFKQMERRGWWVSELLEESINYVNNIWQPIESDMKEDITILTDIEISSNIVVYTVIILLLHSTIV